MTLTRSDLVESLSNSKELTLGKRDAIKLVESVFEEIASTLESGQDVKLSSFGNFDLRNKAERPGRNPKTGEVIAVSARRVVTFHPGQKLKTVVESVDKDIIN